MPQSRKNNQGNSGFLQKAKNFVSNKWSLVRMESTVGSVYSFQYVSKTASDPSPIILNIRRRNQRIYLGKNGKRYMGGINIRSFLSESPATAELVLEQLGKRRYLSWTKATSLAKIMNIEVATLYRTYDMQKVQNLTPYRIPK